MRRPRHDRIPPPTLLFWTLTDEVIEQRELLDRQFSDIRSSGFGGVAAFVRCSRYTWYDPLARKALRRVGRLCRQHGMQSWIGPDPRFVSRLLIPSSGGLEVLLFGNRAKADVFPNLAPVMDGRFTVRCDVSPRHVHTLQDVAIEYAPWGIERLYAIRLGRDGMQPVEVRDVTVHARFFYNARDHYAEAFGGLPARFRVGEWHVLAFFRASTNHMDFSDPAQMQRYLHMLSTLKKEGCAVDGVMWDEPGFTCTYGTLPYSPRIRRSYTSSTGHNIRRDLWRLALGTGSRASSDVRVAYYRAVQNALNDANDRFTEYSRQLWGSSTVSGIHDTWHFESADMCDMNHGSLDLWEAATNKTGGFVDLGGIDKLREPNSPWNANLAAMNVIGATLGKISSGGYAYNNLWTVGDDGGKGWQASVMDHCVNTMALFGTRWLAHAYGPVGTIGEEQSFLGSPPMPGYPDHSTWRFFPAWNRRLAAHVKSVEQRLPESNVLVMFPVEFLYGLAGTAADTVAAAIFHLILTLLDHHFHVDVLSPSACAGAFWRRGEYVRGDSRYRKVIMTAAGTPEIHRLLTAGGQPVFRLQPQAKPAHRTTEGRSPEGVLAELEAFPDLRPVVAPAGCWATMTRASKGVIVTLSPSRHGNRYRGEVSLHGATVQLPGECAGLTRILFPESGTAEIIPMEQKS